MARKGGMISEKPPSKGGDGGFGKDKNIGKDFGTYDRDDDSWIRGYVGGEVPGGNTRFGDCGDWDGDEGECNDCADWDFSGPEYDHLGHFRQAKYLRDGHNTMGGLMDDGAYHEQIGPPEKKFPSGPQGHDEDEERSGPPVRIPGTGNRPF